MKENSLSSWLRGRWRGQERKKNGGREVRRNGQEKRRKKRTKRSAPKGGVSAFFRRRLLTSSVKGKIWRVVEMFLGVNCSALPKTVVSALVSDVPVSTSSVVTKRYEDVSLDCDLEFVEPQSFSFSKKRSSVCAENQGEMSCEGSPGKAPPTSRRRMMSPTPQQISLSSTDESQWQADLEAHRSIWSTRERRVSAEMENYLDESDDMKVEIEALELLMDPEDSEVCLGYILMHARRRGSRIFEIFSTKRKLTTEWQAETAGWSTKERVAQQERWLSDLQDVDHEGTMAKAFPCPERRMWTPLPQQSSSSAREEESQWISAEDKRKWCVASRRRPKEC